MFDFLASDGDLAWAFHPILSDSLTPNPLCISERNCFDGSLTESGECAYLPLDCGDVGLSCNSESGECQDINARVLSIAVIDESSIVDSTIDALWSQFRSSYQSRQVCLLQVPPANDGRLHVPQAFLDDARTTFDTVNRDEGVGTPSDWYAICGVEDFLLQNINFVGLFIDNSGSMTTASVQASYDLFVQKLNENDLSFRTLENTDENWVAALDIVAF